MGRVVVKSGHHGRRANLDGVSLAEHPGLGDGHFGYEVPYVRVVERHLLASVYLNLSEHGACRDGTERWNVAKQLALWGQLYLIVYSSDQSNHNDFGITGRLQSFSA